MATFTISKSYEGHPSKNVKQYKTGLTIEEVKDFFDSTAARWARLGGLIVEQTEDSLTVEESDASETIVFEAIEE